MGNPIGARKCGTFKAVSTAPSINKTPVGSSTPPLPYPTVQDLANSVSILPSVLLNGDPVYVLDQSTQPSCKGDDPGTALGVRSGTVNGEVKPVKGSTTVRAGGKSVVRENDPCTMNGGNNPGIYITTQIPSCGVQNGATTADTDPPIKAQTPEEEGWLRKLWNKTKEEVAAAAKNPWEGVKGAAKGIANIPSDLGEMFIKGSTLQSAADMEQAAAWQSLFGQTETAQALTQTAQEMRAGAESISLPKFQMSNAAQAGGDKIATGVSLLAGGAGIVKSGAKGLGTLGKAGAAATEGAEAAKGLSTGAKAADVAAAPKAAAAVVDTGAVARSADATVDAGRSTHVVQRSGAATGEADGLSSGAKTTNAAKPAEVGQGGGKAAESPGNGVKVAARKQVSANFTSKQLDKKFKHAEDFGVSTTKKNPETLKQYQSALQSHLDDAATYQHGTYQYVPNSVVHFNPTTNNVVVLSNSNDFVTGWKLSPGTPQFENFLKNGVLR